MAGTRDQPESAGVVVDHRVAVVVSVAYGARSLPYSSVIRALLDYDPSNFDHLAVRSRIPRTLIGLLAGVALALHILKI